MEEEKLTVKKMAVEGERYIKFLRKSKEIVGPLYPVLVDESGRVIDGHKRLKADITWPTRTLKLDTSEKRLIATIHANMRIDRNFRDENLWGNIARLADILKERGLQGEELLKEMEEKTFIDREVLERLLPKEYLPPKPKTKKKRKQKGKTEKSEEPKKPEQQKPELGESKESEGVSEAASFVGGAAEPQPSPVKESFTRERTVELRLEGYCPWCFKQIRVLPTLKIAVEAEGKVKSIKTEILVEEKKPMVEKAFEFKGKPLLKPREMLG